MKFLPHLRYNGITLRMDDAGSIQMAATDPTMTPAVAAAYIKRHRDAILIEISEAALPGLPTACPLSDGGNSPEGCRYATPLLLNLMQHAVLPDPDKGCPMREVCGLWSLWPTAREKTPPVFVPDIPADPAPPADSAPGNCEDCPAAATWDFGHYARLGLLCFHDAYFKIRAGKPKPCADMGPKCPRGSDRPLS